MFTHVIAEWIRNPRIFFSRFSVLWTLLMDLLIIIAIPLLRGIIDSMLKLGRPCSWTIIGLQCGTCGGTHCLESFLRLDFVGSFYYNPLVFSWIIYAILSVILANFAFLFKKNWAIVPLKHMYSEKVFWFALATYFLYSIFRNVKLFI